MSKRNVNDAVDRFLGNGGEVIKLRYAGQKELDKSSRNFYHMDKATAGSGHSKEIISKKKNRESALIFSREDRWIEV